MRELDCEIHPESESKACLRCGDFICKSCFGLLKPECGPCEDHVGELKDQHFRRIQFYSVLRACFWVTFVSEAWIYCYHLGRHQLYFLSGMGAALNFILLPYAFYLSNFILKSVSRFNGHFQLEDPKKTQVYFTFPAVAVAVLFVSIAALFYFLFDQTPDEHYYLYFFAFAFLMALQFFTVQFTLRSLGKLRGAILKGDGAEAL